MSLVWLFLLDLILLSTFAASSRASHFRRAHLPPMKAAVFAQGTSRSIVHISKGPPEGVAMDWKVSYIEGLNSSIQDPHWRKYTMWQALGADGKTNLCILFFTVYISYLIYVLF